MWFDGKFLSVIVFYRIFPHCELVIIPWFHEKLPKYGGCESKSHTAVMWFVLFYVNLLSKFIFFSIILWIDFTKFFRGRALGKCARGVHSAVFLKEEPKKIFIFFRRQYLIQKFLTRKMECTNSMTKFSTNTYHLVIISSNSMPHGVAIAR